MNSPPGSCIPLSPEPNIIPNPTVPEPAADSKTSFPVVPVAIGVVALGAVGAFFLFRN